MSLPWEEEKPTMNEKKPTEARLNPSPIWTEATGAALMAPAFSSLLNRALQMGYLITPCLLPSPSGPLLFAFPPSSPMSGGAALGQSGSDQTGELGMARALSASKGTNKRPAVPNPAGGILRKYHSQHSQVLLPPYSKPLDAKTCVAAIRQHLHFQ